MKKKMCLLLIAALSLFCFTGCSKPQEDAPQADASANFNPETTAAANENNSIDDISLFGDQPTVEPVETLVPENGSAVPTQNTGNMEANQDGNPTASPSEMPQSSVAPANIDASAYQFSTVGSNSLGITLQYPSQWENIPGIYTICYRESVEEGDFPARMAVTSKKVVHTPDEEDIVDQLKSYLKTIYTQYDTSTFEVTNLNQSISFMGKQGYSTTYLAYSGEIEVKGFVIACAIERNIYVFHFCASFADYSSMESMMQYMCKSVALAGEN